MFVGLTGLMGAGKSKVADLFMLFAGEGIEFCLHNTDDLAKKAINTQDGKDFIRKRFGEEYIVDGDVDFSSLGKLVFSDERHLRDLEAYSHPIVKDWVKKNYEPNKINIVENAILFECGMNEWMDFNIYVTCHPCDRKQRLYDRGMSDSDIQKRQKFQVSISPLSKIKKSRYHIDNTLGFFSLNRTIRNIIKEIQNETKKV